MRGINARVPLLLILLILIPLWTMQPALADGAAPGVGQEMADHPPDDPACRADIQSLCAGVEPGAGRLGQCLHGNEAKLSEKCRENIQEHQAASKEDLQHAKTVCKTDYTRFCSTVRPGGGRIIRCLGQHSADLAPECRQALQSAHQP